MKKFLLSLLIFLPIAVVLAAKADVEITYRRMVNAGEYVKFSIANVSGNTDNFEARFILKDAAGETVFTSPWSSFAGKTKSTAVFDIDTLPWAYTDHLNCLAEVSQNGKITRYKGFSPIQVEVAVNAMGSYDRSLIRQATGRIAEVGFKRKFDDRGKMIVSVAAPSPILKVEGMCNGQAILTMPGNDRKKFSFEVPSELTLLVRNFKVTLADGKSWYSNMMPARMTRDIRRVRVWHEKVGRPVWVMVSGSRLRPLSFKRKCTVGTLTLAGSADSGLTAFNFSADILQKNSSGVQMIAECKGVFQLLSDNGKIILITRAPGEKYFLRCDSGLKLIPEKTMQFEWFYNFYDQTVSLGGKEVECKFVELGKDNPLPDKIGKFNGTVSRFSIRYGN